MYSCNQVTVAMFQLARLAACLVLACFCHVAVSRSTPQDDSYVAAILEYDYNPFNMASNLPNYLHYITEAANQSADIMVFPEMTLTRTNREVIQVPIYDLLKEYPTPALHPELFDEALVAISSAARQHQVYVVINIQEGMNCSSSDAANEYCPERKAYLFNTNVVFDRNGTVISRYRKTHLFGELGRSPSLKQEMGVFDTDFGVKFGHFICFDLMFQTPAVKIVNDVTDVIFTTMWFSELPYLTAVQIQEAYAYKNKINFLASGANRVAVGSAGSGIYSGEAGALVSTMPGKQVTRLLVARVPKVPGQNTHLYSNPGPLYDPPADHDELFLKVDPSLPAARSLLLEEGMNDVQLVEGAVTCSFTVNLTHGVANEHYRYHAAAFDGVRTFDNVASGGQKSCAVLACAGSHASTCGSRFPTYNSDSFATFRTLSITATVPTPVFDSSVNAMDSIYYPVSVTSSIMPLEPDQYTFTNEALGNRTEMQFNLRYSRRDLYSFAVWGRVFETDGREPTPARDSSSAVLMNCVLVFVVSLYHLF